MLRAVGELRRAVAGLLAATLASCNGAALFTRAARVGRGAAFLTIVARRAAKKSRKEPLSFLTGPPG